MKATVLASWALCRTTAFIFCFIALALLSPARAGTTGTIEGHVVDTGGQGIAGAIVSATSPSGHFNTTSARDGFYALNGLPVDTYTITASKDGYQTTSIPGVTVVQDQASRINARLSPGVKSLGRVTVRGSTSLVQPTVTADTYVVNQQRLSDLNGTPQDLNGFQAFNSLPGVTPDNTGFPTIRAGASNDVGYELDGVDNTEIGEGEYLNALTLNGARSVQLSTGGYDVSNGNTNSGVINEVIQRGTYPPKGQATMRIDSPVFGHELSIDFGGATPNNRFSYYYSFGGYRHGNGYGDLTSTFPLEVGQTVFDSVNDNILNLFYHFGKGDQNEIQFLTNISGETIDFNYLADPAQALYAPSNGDVQFSSDPFGICTPSLTAPFPPCNTSALQSNYITLFPGQQTISQPFINYPDTQTFNSYLDKINFKRQLTPSSFADVRLTKTYLNWIDRYPFDLGSFTDHYFNEDVSAYGAAFDYTNQISSKNEISGGAEGVYYKTNFYLGNPSLEPTYEPLEALGCAAAAGALGAQQAGGCYIAPFNAALNAALGLGLPTDAAHAPLTSYVNDYSNSSDPLHRWDAWVKDRWQPNERVTVTVGLRWDKEALSIPANAAELNTTYFIDTTTPSGCGAAPAPPCNIVTVPGQSIGTDVTQPQQVSPRVAASYELGPRDTIRFSYGKNIEFIPLSGLENTYQLPSSLQNCNIANHCFVPLPGFGSTNHVTNLYQQVMLDLTTNDFQQYTPVLPQTAIN
ncbi:MAG: carboxypeptidase regulatory-like domain-containing protein, partial [Candidatus Eremiobacteraeota bacterium]|nr:carboxypeptidase regulatory-like domain-containing protein [Candidatus Eremiobacteraeota bacterium]